MQEPETKSECVLVSQKKNTEINIKKVQEAQYKNVANYMWHRMQPTLHNYRCSRSKAVRAQKTATS